MNPYAKEILDLLKDRYLYLLVTMHFAVSATCSAIGWRTTRII